LFLESVPRARPGTEIPVILRARVDEPINALRTTLRFDPAAVAVTGTDDRGSVVRYWLIPPAPSADGSLQLEGIVPGGVGPGFTDTVRIAQFTVVASRTGAVVLRLEGTTVYLNQPDAVEAAVAVRPLTIIISPDAPEVSIASASGADEAYLAVVSEPELNGGAWTLVADIRTVGRTPGTVLVRERRFGLGGSWNPVSGSYQLSDQSRMSILEVAVPDGADERVVGRIVPFRLRALWAAVALVIVGSALRALRLVEHI
jgi:hypothetical protein